MLSTKRTIIAVAATTALTLSLAACGSGDDDSTANPGSSTGSGDSGGSKDSFKIGAIGTYSGPLASSIGPAKPGIEAWAKTVNAAGGIDGHKVELIVKDDAGNPTTGLAAAKQLVEQEKVIAIVGQASSVFTGWQDYVDDKKIPVIGGVDVGGAYGTDPNWFSVGGSADAGNEGIAKTIKDKGLKNIGYIGCTESPACAHTKDIYAQYTKKYDLGYPVGQLLSSAQPDYTAICLTLRDAKVEAVTTGFPAATIIKIFTDCAKQGYKPFIGGNGNAITTEFLTAPALNGLIATHQYFPFTDSSTPETKAFQAAVAGQTINPFSSAAWSAGKMFEAVVKAGKLGNGATAADVYQGIYAIPAGETLNGLIPPVTYKDGQPSSSNCYFVQEVKDGAFVQPQGLKTTCLS